MSIGKSSFESTGDSFPRPESARPELTRPTNSSRSLKGLARRKREQRRRQDRHALLESLEHRHLMAGPNLVGIQPNENTLLVNDAQLNTAPRELVFRFDDATAIDEATLSGIQVTRAGDDAVFESARATSDVGTNGAALLEFRARQAGTAGEGVTVQFTSSSRPGSGAPTISASGKTVLINLNSNPLSQPTTVRGLISAIESNAQANLLLQVFSVSGSTSTQISSTAISGMSVVLRGANAADAVSDLGTNNAIRVRFLAATSGAAGRGTRVVLERANFGGPANPLVLVTGNQVVVRVNSNPGNETTIAELLTAINTNPEASRIVFAVQETGLASTVVGNRVGFVQTITLTGATDILVEPGYIGLGDSPNEVVFRFASTLPADTYQIDIFGTGINALTNVAGEAFNNGENLSRRFTLNLGPKVLAVVPEPIRRNSSGGLSPEVGIIEVHFDNNALDLTSAQDARNYQLVYTADTINPADDVIRNPTSVTYNRSTNIARLTFAGPLTQLGPGAARLRVGVTQTTQSRPQAPTMLAVDVEPADTFNGAFDAGNLTPTEVTGARSVRLQSRIENTVEFGLNLPGADVAGVRSIRPDDPGRLNRVVPLDYFRQGPDSLDGISEIHYDFASTFRGDDPNSPGLDNNRTYFNLITEQQKERVREVLSLFSEYLGVQFVEQASGAAGTFFTFAVGELYGADVTVNSAEGGVVVATRDRDPLNGLASDLVVLDFQDFEQSDDDEFGREFFRGAMLGVGQVLGYGYADGLPQPVTQSTRFVENRARGETTLGTGASALFEIVSVLDASTNTITNIQFAVDPQAATAVPVFNVNGGVITITLSSNPDNVTLAANLVAAAVQSPVVNGLITISQLRGAATTPIGSDTTLATSAAGISVRLSSPTNEPTYPSVVDIVNGQYLYRPDSTDIDLYRFTLQTASKVSVQTFAERLTNSSLLNTHLRLYRLIPTTGAFEEIAQNDDYFSNDSLIELDLAAGTYVVGVSSTGNDTYNPVISGTGFGGRTQGAYELRITTQVDSAAGMRGENGVLLDGDGNGTPGGIFDFWFVPANANNTLYVDKIAPSAGSGSISAPFRNLGSAIAAAAPGTTIRVLANGGVDGRLETPEDNFSYQIGVDDRGNVLADGATLDLPAGVRLVIDAGAIFKMRAARVGVGSVAPLVDVSNSAIQILGTPTIIDGNGLVVRDSFGQPIPGSVYFTSINDSTLGRGSAIDTGSQGAAGDWGGIDLRGDLDAADTARRNRENEGVFLNHLQFADLRFGGGQVRIGGRSVVVSPVDMAITRATIINSRISNSADAAIAATPDTFRETRFDEPNFQQNGAFIPTVHRVGPEIHGNTIIDNSINGLFIRVVTRTGDALQPLTEQARFDDTDIVHVLTENLQIKGTPGGPLSPSPAPSSLGISVVATNGGGSVPAGTYVYQVSFASTTGESAASGNTTPATLSATGQIRLNQIPAVPAGSGFTMRRIYRAPVVNGVVGDFLRIADINGTDASHTDIAAQGTIAVPPSTGRLVARLDASLKVDPGTVIKVSGARIDTTFGANFIAEGDVDGRIVITSLKDRRFGAGGTFNTGSDEPDVSIEAGDWGGIFIGHTAAASLDRVTLAGAGGTVRVEGGFASFNAIEVHQGELRLANSRLEFNASGRDFVDLNAIDRIGRGPNASGTIFVRGAQPVVVNNDFIDGAGPILSFDVNSLVWNEVADLGRSTGLLDQFPANGNSGPLIAGNRLDDTREENQRQQLNGLEIRGGQVATEVVWDDVDMVHIVRDMIEVPNQHIFGGLRLESDARGSLVVKFANTPAIPQTATTPAVPARTAGIVAGGTLGSAVSQFVDIADRIGGSLQIVGAPDFPVVLTSLRDNTIGAGFTPTGQPLLITDTTAVAAGGSDVLEDTMGLPLGPIYDGGGGEVDNLLVINNDLPANTYGFFSATVANGGDVNDVDGTGLTPNNQQLFLNAANLTFLNTTYIDVDYLMDPSVNPIIPVHGQRPIQLSATTITAAATRQDLSPINRDRVVSTGTIDLLDDGDGLLEWQAESFILNDRAVIYTRLTFNTSDQRAFNTSKPGLAVSNIQSINYLDTGIDTPSAVDDVLYSVGTPGQADFRAFVLDGPTRVGFSHGGVYAPDQINQLNASYVGWNAANTVLLEASILNETLALSPAGVINPLLPPLPNAPAIPGSNGANGPGSIATAFAWDLTLTENTAIVTSLVEWQPADPANRPIVNISPPIAGTGAWNGITIREATNDRNVAAGAETETRLATLSDSNAIPSQAQFLGELAPNAAFGDENRRLGFIVDGTILVPSDVDTYSFVAEAGTQVWLDIDRTSLGLDAVLELVDVNGVTIALSDDSLAESRGDLTRLVPPRAGFDASSARSLNSLPIPAGSATSAFQDDYSINPRDPGMRVVLPGLPGQRNLYHVRVRSSNVSNGVTGAARENQLLNGNVRAGLTSGNYQLQIRLREADETAGTQIRFSDVRFAVNGVQIVGGPLHSPLVGDEFETSLNNDTIANAQPLGLFDISTDRTVTNELGLLASDRLAKSVAGSLSSATDVDWYRFNVNYQNLTRDNANLYLSTIFDIDYADGFARSDVAIYVFNGNGQLIFVGGDSNIADDQPTGDDGSDNADLSRGSGGTLDPYIGATELAEGNYFVAVVNQSFVPNLLNQFSVLQPLDPLFRLEPIESVTRIAEDHIESVGGGTASLPTVPLLFNGEASTVPYAFNDVILYTLDGSTVGISNPLTGQDYGSIGNVGGGFRDFAFLPNGELFAFSTPNNLVNADLDLGYSYFRINSETGALANIGLTGLETFHVVDPPPILVNGQITDLPPTVVDSNDGITVEAMTFASNTRGYFVGNRPIDHFAAGNMITQNVYFQNIVYAFDPQTGSAQGLGAPNRQVRTIGQQTFDDRANGAGTQIRERGYIETGSGRGVQGVGSQLVVPNATQVTNGITTPLINDGDDFRISLGTQSFVLELDGGPILNFATNPLAGAFPVDGVVFTLTTSAGTQTYELDSGPVIAIEVAQLIDGATATLQDSAGVSVVFEFDSNNLLLNSNAIPVPFVSTMTSAQVADAFAAAINAANFGVDGFATPGQGRVDLVGDSTTVAPILAGAGLSIARDFGGVNDTVAGSRDPNIPASNVIRIQENFTGTELAQAIAAATGGAVAGTRVNYRNLTGLNITNLIARGVVTQTGTIGVTTGSTPVPFLVSDTSDAIAIRIRNAINSTPAIQAFNITASASRNVVSLVNATLNPNDGSVSDSFSVGGVPPGGIVTGIAMVGSTMYAVSSAGGLYSVANPGFTVEGNIGTYVSTATDLIGLNFSGLSVGPQNVEGGRFSALLFGVTTSGDLYAFDTLGRLRNDVFANGATSINIGAGTRGVDFSTLDFNLWHVTDSTSNSNGLPGHGINANANGTRAARPGGSSYYFGAEASDADIIASAATSPFAVPRQDGQAVRNTYNFPGGAKGAIESNPFSLNGYSAGDLPTLYFNYYLTTDGFDSVSPGSSDRDAFRVYAITEDGVEHLLATNNLALAPSNAFDDEFDDPTLSGNPAIAARYSDDIFVDVQPLFDNTNNWRQARVSLAELAGLANIRLRVEFSTGASFGDGTLGIRAIAGNQLVDGQTIEISGRTFEIDLGTTLSIPSGSQIANFYALPSSTPATRVTVNVAGVTYVLDDGTRNVDTAAGEVRVQLQVQGDGELSSLTAATVAERLATAIRATAVPLTTVPFDFSRELNDELATATQLPNIVGNTILTGNGSFSNASDVDLFRLEVPAGARVTVSIDPASGSLLTGNVRLFNAQGQPLPDALGNPLVNASGQPIPHGTTGVPAVYTSPIAQTIFIGLSRDGNTNYSPLVAVDSPPGVVGNYVTSVRLESDFQVNQNGGRLQVSTGFAVTADPASLVSVNGAPGTTGIPVVINASMTPEQVAESLRRAIAREFSNGVLAAYPLTGSTITLPGLTLTNEGPFGLIGIRSSDIFGSTGTARAVSNNHEGVFIDDFIIGFAERGELATTSSTTALSQAALTAFSLNPALNLTSPARVPTSTVTGSYQLEIRDASEYINSATNTPFRTFDTNDQLSTGLSIRVAPLADIIDGASFTISDGISSVTFEFDIENTPGIGDGVMQGRVRIGIPAASTLLGGDDGADEVARAVVAAIRNPAVQSLINVSAVPADGVDSLGNSRINLFGNVVVTSTAGSIAEITQRNLRGDANRDRSEQGVIMIENNRFVFNQRVGIDIIHDSTSRVSGVDAQNSTPNVVAYPRNLIELNSQSLVPGVVVQNNVVAFNQDSGIQISGFDTTSPAFIRSGRDSVPFDRILNNTIIGGVVVNGPTPQPATFAGINFPSGAISFADQIPTDPANRFRPGQGVSPGFNNPLRAIGAPDSTGRGAEPIDGLTTVSLGLGGVLTVQFVDNVLTGSGDARPDLIIFESGEIESVRVDISRDGVSFVNVGVVGGIDMTVDLDAFGFGPQDRFSFVRLTDLRQGTLTSGPAGADIDAVGAISTAPRDTYLAGGQGIVVGANAAPTLLNNVIANTQTAVAIDTTSPLTVLGGTSFYRNTRLGSRTDAESAGSFAQILPAALELFVDPVRLAFSPRAGVPIIDSSIDSLEDRSSLRIVRDSIGLPPSPIIAPRLDVSGQLRVDDPSVNSPPGIGERVFKDRGAADRADQVGPRAVLLSPRAADLGAFSGQAETARGTVFDAFDIQLIDGIGPADPTPGVGIDDATVTSNSVLLSRDGVILVEGVDYRFGYDASNNVIRLTPIAGIWEDDSTYVIRLLDASDSVLRFGDATTLSDGGLTTLLTVTGVFRDFEIEKGVTINVNPAALPTAVDGQVITVFDGVFSLNFELNNNLVSSAANIPVTIPTTATAEQIATALANAIADTALNVTVNSAGSVVQLLGTSSLISATPVTPAAGVFTVEGAVGTLVGFGIGIPTTGSAIATTVRDGQTFTIRRGATLVRTFELDFGNGTLTPNAIPVTVGASPTLDQLADAIVRAVGGAGLGLAPINAGQGRVVLGGDANYSLDVSTSGLVQLGFAGQTATVPVVIPVDATIEQVVAAYATAINGAGLTGVSTSSIGDRLVLDGVEAVSGVSAVPLPIIRDQVGNRLQSSRITGRTELFVFVGGGFDYGDAPAPYNTLASTGGPRHRVDRSFTLGQSITPDADALVGDGDIDDGVALVGTVASGFPATFTIEVNADNRNFYVDAWIDWNRNGQFEPTEVTRYRSVNAPGAGLPVLGVGVNTVSINVPAGISNGVTYARFRLSEVSGLGPNGDADSGEVEDLAILLQSNPFQNPLNSADVNKSGTVTPLDSLNVINLLAIYNRNRGENDPAGIPLNPPPAFMTDIVNGRFLPDVDGNGMVTPTDALRVINELSRVRNSLGEGEGNSFIALGNGLLASPLTVATSQSVVPSVPSSNQSAGATGQDQTKTANFGSVFDSAQVMALDGILDELALDDRKSSDDATAVDQVFSGLGLGL